MVDLLGEVRQEKLILRRSLEEASSMAKGFKYYIMELWELNKDAPTVRVKSLVSIPWNIGMRLSMRLKGSSSRNSSRSRIKVGLVPTFYCAE